MTTGTWTRLAIAGMLALASCAHHREATPADKRAAAAQQAQQRQQQAYEQARKTEQELDQAHKRVTAADQEVAKAEQQLAQARQRAERERQAARELEARQRRQLAEAAEAVRQSEEQQGLGTVAGRIVEGTPSRVVVETPDGRTMSFRVEQRTKVLVGATQRSVAEIQQGADARVAYDPSAPEPAAITIHVWPAGTLTPAAPGSAPPAAPPPQR